MSLVTIVWSMVCNAILLVYHMYTRVFRLHPSDSVINTPLMTDLLLNTDGWKSKSPEVYYDDGPDGKTHEPRD
ncbi:hypothetical protein AZE42_14067 [Rhizopogon vesiculosus]|uniref:Uncharacterized protein n=1 Tax=Rhizopogon vesiculosus TaxID=180088 RepID=A0A1J8R6S6_9AGAM|nr:hypothetical protein AZE42_14067 [Rhizopogon vesiculosus]